MKKYSANYSHSNHNFVIQNLQGERISNEYLPAICILKNILQRGKPTLLSNYLQDELGQLHREQDFLKAYPLIDKGQPNWERIIRGDEKGNYYPAKKFFEELIPKYLSDYEFIQQLIIPEITINEITQVSVDEYVNQQVDFYLPQAYLIIEIDGSQHEKNKEKDKLRDLHTEKYGIHTVRIKTFDLESENDIFLQKIQEIKIRIDKVKSKQEIRKKKDTTFISLSDYQTVYKNGIDFENPNYKATAIIRFQLLVLELLENGLLNLKKDWNLEILSRDITGFEKIAIEDLMIWFKHILKLHKITFEKPIVSLSYYNSVKDFSNNNNSIKIDFSLTKRYTDEFQTNSNIIYVRTDYLDEFLYFKKGDSRDNLKFSSFEPYDYFQITTTNTIKYKLILDGEKSDEPSLLFFLGELFLQTQVNLKKEKLSFREGQLPIIASALSKMDTIGLLPTGSGKSVCYQLSAILQPAISFVVCPIKSLMFDQKFDLDSVLFSRTNHITSDDDGEEQQKIKSDFKNGKYFFIFISPERFQDEDFRKYFSSVNQNFKIAYSIIDEVHCLSEWGHSFRLSYLNLSRTIKRLTSDFTFLGLTATASLNVLEDIKIEFGSFNNQGKYIPLTDENVRTPEKYTREELEFSIINDETQKYSILKQEIVKLKNSIGALSNNGAESKCGIIFTPHVNGDMGCFQKAEYLERDFNVEVPFYSGSIPNKSAFKNETEFNKYKSSIQNRFKNNEFTLLTATKAFGMGINKGNIHYTIHYGVPTSIESLYQEAGRAGRNKNIFSKDNKAKCIVLFSKSSDENLLNAIWNEKTQLTELLDKATKEGFPEVYKIISSQEQRVLINEGYEITKGLISKIDNDVSAQLFLFASNLNTIQHDFNLIKQILNIIQNSKNKAIYITGKDINSNKFNTEFAIYRLTQLGIITDWTVSNYSEPGGFKIYIANNIEENFIKDYVISTIRKYDKVFSFNEILNGNDKESESYKKILTSPKLISNIDRYIYLLLQWSYNQFTKNRKKSLQNVYETCNEFITKDDFGSVELQNRLESYFSYNPGLQLIAENPNKIKEWFEVFYKKNKKKVTTIFITKEEQINLKDSLSRTLESYHNNIGLNIISGLLRLLLDDYENVDGKSRFETSLERIQSFDFEKREFIFEQILKIGQELSAKNKSYLAESLYKFFASQEFLFKISKSLNDNFSSITIVDNANKRLKTINQKIYEGLAK